MSYCRWSSDQFQCDVYVYKDVSGGWTTHVASRRDKWKAPNMPLNHVGKWHWYITWWWYTIRNRFWSEFRGLYDIGLEHDGESFNHDTPGECADWLQTLLDLGYKVPQYTIDSLREEENESSTN